jgi:hypothetical protein
MTLARLSIVIKGQAIRRGIVWLAASIRVSIAESLFPHNPCKRTTKPFATRVQGGKLIGDQSLKIRSRNKKGEANPEI